MEAGGGTLEEVVVTATRALASSQLETASEGTVTQNELGNRALLRPAEVLEAVPGLAVTQHSGDGKANQYFLRGFNLDHGTDFSTSVDGVPVNMPTHGHGQGYSDLNFLIPELVEHIDYRKGVYYAEDGDFSAAGAAEIHYCARLDAPFVTLSAGADGYRRVVAATSTARRWTAVARGRVRADRRALGTPRGLPTAERPREIHPRRWCARLWTQCHGL